MPSPTTAGGIWPAINAADAPAMIAFLVDVLGFRPQLIVPGDEPGVIVHSQMAWPEGGVVQVSSANRRDSVYSQQPMGTANLYVITA
ncbi:MAG: glyoxalase, partial [Acidimicrobiales bacterium]|nr:glyoxalase [Acidimicrobiales bacterium]